MTSEVNLVITAHGIERWTTTKHTMKVNEPALMDSLSKNVIRKCDRIANVGGPFGLAAMTCNSTLEMWSVHVNKLHFECPFYLQDGVHSPAFGDTNQPTMKLEWIPNMSLVLGITVLRDGYYRLAGDHYLVAFDMRGNLWRLPVSNLYEDGKLCHGQPALKYTTSLECVLDCCKRFSSSKWNHDLYHLTEEKRFRSTRDMFRWKPEATGFTQLDMTLAAAKDWTSLCQKISSETLSQLIVNV